MIVIYATSSCGWCKKAKSLCEQYKLPREYIVIDSEETKAEFKQKFPDAKTVPQITWHEKAIGGYEDLLREIEDTRTYGDGAL
jgi:glutaredoxin